MTEKSEKMQTSEFKAQQLVLIKFQYRSEKLQYKPKSSWVHLLVVQVFQRPWFISGTYDLVMVESQKR